MTIQKYATLLAQCAVLLSASVFQGTSQDWKQELQRFPVPGIGVSSEAAEDDQPVQLQHIISAELLNHHFSRDSYPSGIASVFVVTTTNDTGNGSLRKAIMDANANPGLDMVTFNIPPLGPKTIIPLSKLPNIVDPVILDGTTQPGFVDKPMIEINGSSMGPYQAFDVFAPGTTIRGVVINRLTGGTGIVLWEGSQGSVVEGNFFGTDLTGTTLVGNVFNGVISRSANNRIGGTAVGSRNLFTGQGNPAIALIAGGNSNVIQGNLFGTDVSGTVNLGNLQDGILIIFGARNDTIGGVTAGARNIISGSTNFSGIAVIGTGAIGTREIVIRGNYIGTDITGNLDFGNARHGIYVRHSPRNTIGGTDLGARNVIAGNGLPGIQIDSAGSTGNVVQGNYIGTRPTGTYALANSKGIVLHEAPGNLIGGSQPGARNLITGNSTVGIEIQGAGATGNKVQGNYIGTDPSGLPGPRNLSHGILVNATQDTIGGLSASDGNFIAYNGGAGVYVAGGTQNLIWNNRMRLNTGLGIDLAPAGVTPNDSMDQDTGPNALQNFPLLDSASISSGSVTIHGRLNSWPNALYTLHFYKNDAADAFHFGEGDSLIGFADVVTNDSGNVSFSLTFPVFVKPDQFITATASNGIGNTSEFSQALCLGDLDGDGILDSWETQGWGIDLNSDNVIDLDLYALGARPDHKDLFVEVDAMTTMSPSPAAIQKVINAFAAVPNQYLNNPDGASGIKLHVQLDDTTLGLVAWPTNWWTQFYAIKRDTFGTAQERSSPNSENILAAKKLVFRYCIFAYSHGTTTSGGQAEDIGSDDFMVTLGEWTPSGGTSDQRAGTFMHELGHTLGLHHGGSDDINYKPNYISIMNYTWQTPFRWADTWRLDYSPTALPTLKEDSLSEQSGLGVLVNTYPPFNVPFSGPGRVKKYASSRPGTSVDWDTSGIINSTHVGGDLNIFRSDLKPSPGEVLTSQSDWPVLLYNFRHTQNFVGQQARPVVEIPEMTYQDFVDLDTLPPPIPRHFEMDGDLDPEAVRITSGNGFALFAAYREGELYVATNSAQSQNADMFVFVTADYLNPGIAAPWSKAGQVPAWDAYLGNESLDNSFHWYDAGSGAKRNNAKAATGGTLLEGVIDLGYTVGREPSRFILAVGKYQTDNGGALLAQAPFGNGNGNIEADGELYSFDPDADLYWYQTAGPASPDVFSLLSVGSEELYAGTREGIFRTSNGGDSWIRLTSGLPNLVRVRDLERSATGLICAATDSGVFISNDNGATWQFRSNGLTNLEVLAMTRTPQGSLLAGTFAGGFRSTNNGVSWIPIANGLPSDAVRCFAIDSTGFVLAGTSSQGVFRSTDDGVSWFQIMSDPNARSLSIDHLGRIYYVKTSPSIVYRSDNGGASWMNILQTSMGSQEVGFVGEQEIYVATAEGVLLSTDDGSTWVDISGGVPHQSTWSLVVSPDNSVYVGTFVDGVCRRLSSVSTGVVDSPSGLPAKAALYQNYPNPFNPSTTFMYEIPTASRVTLKVYNILGQEITTLVDATQPAGRHAVEWNASGVASGVYLYRIQAGTFLGTRKLLLLR